MQRAALLCFALAVNAAPLTLPGPVVGGWNTSVGTAQERAQAAATFGVNVSTGDSVWLNNTMTPYIGKTMKMTAIDITERNAFNTVIELAVKTGTVLWTMEKGPLTCMGSWVEHIDGTYTGEAHMAGWMSTTTWIENDHKSLFGHEIKNDWGITTVMSATDSDVVLKYWSYQKGKFTMTWSLNY
eukprot:Hpha_TRINITY_DN3297_c0_g1::TRINITY_DN3297_c0_g1_i1::g.185880::m.185880